jgi:outer membrane protein assembly factor BamB
MKNIIALFTFVSFIIACNSCKKQIDEPTTIIDKDGVVLKQPYLWKTSLTDSPYIGTFIYPSLICDNKMIFGAETNNSSELALINIETGEKIWQKPYASKENIAVYSAYQINNTAIVDDHNANAVARCLNIETGDFLWTFDKPGWFSPASISGIDNTFFLCGQTQTVSKPYQLYAAWYGNIETGETSEFFVPDITAIADTSSIVKQTGIAGGVESINPFKNQDGDVLLIIYHSTFFKSPAGEHYFSLYNFTKKIFIYRDIQLSASGSFKIYKNKIYFTLFKEMCCYDLYTGSKIWSKSVPHLIGDLVITDNCIIAPQIDLYDSFLISMNIQNGNLNWKVPTNQNLGYIRLLNGVIYFVSTGDAKLHAYEASTGRELWRIESPDYAHDSGAFFMPECTVIPGKNGEKGKVIVSSYLNGFCYEAAR